jgi:hypothetical protein
MPYFEMQTEPRCGMHALNHIAGGAASVFTFSSERFPISSVQFCALATDTRRLRNAHARGIFSVWHFTAAMRAGAIFNPETMSRAVAAVVDDSMAAAVQALRNSGQRNSLTLRFSRR